MERITLEHAKQFISLDDDFTNKTVQDCPHFTLTPSPKGDGWETVTYYTARKLDMYANRGGDYDSWVYILSNPTQPNLYKIGYTKNTPDERAKQISNATGVALPYKVEWAYQCFNGEMVEREVHHKLKAQRVNSHKEFFQVSLEEAKENIILIGNKFK